jgi:hypothetical protein
MTRHTPAFIVWATLILFTGACVGLALHSIPVTAVCAISQGVVALIGAVGIARTGPGRPR